MGLERLNQHVSLPHHGFSWSCLRPFWKKFSGSQEHGWIGLSFDVSERMVGISKVQAAGTKWSSFQRAATNKCLILALGCAWSSARQRSHEIRVRGRTFFWETCFSMSRKERLVSLSLSSPDAQGTGGGLSPGSTQVRTLGLDQRGGRPNINIKNLGSTQVQPRFNPGSTQFEPTFNPGSTQVL